tara:strand:+ start:124 stop:486 length:363 start_codon:yes stop_codon:yes gene_type:complete
MPTIRRGERGRGTGRGRRPSVKKATAAQKARKPSTRGYATGSAVKPSRIPGRPTKGRTDVTDPRQTRTVTRGERGRGTGSSRRPSVRAATAAQRAKRPSRSVGLKRGGRVSKAKGGKAKR